jgi:hypothetical protein
MQIWFLALRVKHKITYPLANLVFGTGGKTQNSISAGKFGFWNWGQNTKLHIRWQIWFLALGAKQKTTYPPADMQIWCLKSGEFVILQGPKFDCFYVPLALCRPFTTVHESDT